MDDTEHHLVFNGLKAWVSVDDKALPLYSVEHDTAKNQVTCWIPSETDKAFCVYFQKVLKDQDVTRVKAFIDGNRVPGAWVMSGPTKYNRKKISAVEASGNVLRRLVFGSIELTDDDNYLDSSLQDVGEIKLIFNKVKITNLGMRLPNFKEYETIQPAKIHERAKKGLAHQIKYGDVVAPRPSRAPVPYMQHGYKDRGLVATFIFRYRPLALLQANGIAPLVTPPLNIDQAKVEILNRANQTNVKTEPSDEDDEDDDDIPEVILEKERALLAELEQVRLAKRAAKSNDKRPQKKVKSEPVHFVPGEIIDLTI